VDRLTESALSQDKTLHGNGFNSRRPISRDDTVPCLVSGLSIKPVGTSSAARAHTRVFWMREAIARDQPINQFERAIDFTAINYSKGERSAIGQYAPRHCLFQSNQRAADQY
jgi:hypothetical protein